MTSDSHKQRYQIAVELYHENKPGDALKLLDDLARERPDSRHIIYYRALCLVDLNRIEEARGRMEELGSFKDSGSKDLYERLQVKLKPALKAQRKKQLAQEAAIRALESDGHYNKPPRKLRYVVAACAVIPCALVAVFVLQSNKAQMTENAGVYSAAGQNTPDQYLEISTIIPAMQEDPMTCIMIMAPSGGATQRADVELNAKVGQHLFGDWDDVRGRLQSGLRLARKCTDPIPGVPNISRSSVVLTLVLPREGLALPEDIAKAQPETYKPGMAVTFTSLVKACGEPDHNESWSGTGRTVGISGRTHWWGNIGIVAGENDEITHILVRAYPQEESAAQPQ